MNNDVELIPVKGVLPSVQVQSDNVIYVPQAHKNKAGIVKEGDGVLIENGVVSLNRQTVEDMIDANKWVSYGFKQNLTEDEKGMARHNIGAGDNYFTGSYYDLTQKPHLNTNNTTGLDYGDEELNDTINLHKISKTGSFNDLKHVPQETLAFAESERQKSKNLLPVSNVSSSSVFSVADDGLITFNGQVGAWSYMVFNGSIYLKAGQSYTLSIQNYTGSGKNLLTTSAKKVSDGTIISDYLYTYGYSAMITPTEDVIIYETRFYFSSSGTVNFSCYLQLEEGSVATDYQPYNGAITHNGDASVVFAESERQKSKNLLNILNASSYTTNGVTLTIEDNIITLNGTTTGFTTFIRPHQLISTNVGKYAFSFKHISGTISGNSGAQSLYYQVGQSEMRYPYTSVINDITSPTDYNQLRIAISTNITFDNFKYSLQYEQGDVATDYQPYNGAIVHEEQIADVEHIKTIYDMSSNDSNINWGYTSGIKASEQVDGVLSFTSPIALNVNKKYRIYVNWGGDMNIFTASVNQYGTRMSGCSAVWAYSLNEGQLQMCEFYYLSGTNEIQLRFRKLLPSGTSIEIQTNQYIYIPKIEEIY